MTKLDYQMNKIQQIRYFLDEFKEKLINKLITKHNAYLNNPYIRGCDFFDNNIKSRISDI